MSLSIIIPTMGRPSLKATLSSIGHQLLQEDEVLVVADGPREGLSELPERGDSRYRFLESPGPADDWGATPRNYALGRARGTHIAFMDDDDTYYPWAFELFRQAIAEAPAQPHIFRMLREGDVLWKVQDVRGANVSTQMFLIPNVPERLGRWSTRYDGDLDFILATVRQYPEGPFSVIWHEQLVAELTSHKRGVF